jgi:hypothetical protein
MSEGRSPLETIVAPLAASDVASLLRERKLKLVRGEGQARHSPLEGVVGWDALLGMIKRGDYPRGRDHIRVAKESVSVPPSAWTTGGEVDPVKLEEHLAQDYSVIVTHLERHVPLLGGVCDEIKSRLSEASYAGVIVTAGTTRAIKLHYDFEDLLIIQIEGTKRWQIYGPAVTNPVRNMPRPPDPDKVPVLDEVLQPGDFLFVPAGNWHHCENGPGRSLHVGLFFIPATPWHAVREMAMSLLADELFRVRFTRVYDPEELAALEAEVKARLLERVNAFDLKGFADRWPKIAYTA